MDKPRISASAIKLGRKCKRRWYFRYVEGIKEPSTPQQEFGIKFHKALENYLRDGTPIPGDTPEGRLAQIGLPHLPNPGAGFVEHQFKFDLGDFEFIGFVDWLSIYGEEVKDHKTTSDFKWALTEAELLEDPAATLYAAAAFQMAPMQDSVKLTWDYYRTKGAAKFKRVEVTFRDQVNSDRLVQLVPEARGLIQLKTQRVEDIDPSPEACFSYGRACPYLDKCPKFTTSQTIRRITQVSPDELLATLRAKQGNGGVAPALPQAVTQAAAPQLPPMQTAPGALPGQLPMFAPSTPPTPPVMTGVPSMIHSQPTLTPAPVDFSQTAGAAPSIAMPGAQPPGFPAGFPGVQPVQAQGVQPPTPPAPPAAPKRRGRPPKNAAPVVPTAPVAPVAPVVQPPGFGQPPGLQAAPSVSETVTPARIGTLFVNCYPICGDETPVNASEVFTKAHEAICSELKIGHYKLAEFGKGPALFAIAVKAMVEADGYDALFVDARTPEGADALDTLMSLSHTVVRGM